MNGISNFPDSHVATSFFAALTFYESFSYLVASPIWLDLAWTITGRSLEEASRTVIFNMDLEARTAETRQQGEGKPEDVTEGIVTATNEKSQRYADSPVLVLSLPLLFLLASLAQFLTSFALTPVNVSDGGGCGEMFWLIIFSSS